jgi:hypothetical protein
MSELASMAAFKTTNTSNSIITTNPNNTTTTTSTMASQQQPNSPALSSTSSLVSPDSSATNPISSPEAQTPQNTPQNTSPLTISMVGTNGGSTTTTTNNVTSTSNSSNVNDDISASTTPTNQIAPIDTSTIDNKTVLSNIIATTAAETKCESPLIDTKSSGSVLDKASMFEKKLEEQHPHTTSSAPTSHPHPISLLNSTLNLTPATVARLESIYGKKTEEIYNKTTTSMDRVDSGKLINKQTCV